MRCEHYGTLPDGRAVQAWHLGCADGPLMTVLSYGARVARLAVPAPEGFREVALGLPDLAAYAQDTRHLGAIAGRYANRIAGGRFTLDGETFMLARNDGANTLHGGPGSFAYAIWDGEMDGAGLLLHHTSPDGENGFPGTLRTTVRYAVEGSSISIDITATTDRPTVFNPTSHAYFNLAGGGAVLDHELTVAAERFTPVDAQRIPTGALLPVAGTPLDFRVARRVGARIDDDDPQLRIGHGYDHNFVLSETARAEPVPAARVHAAGLTLDVLTTEPGLQLYSGNFLAGQPHPRRGGLCLETQHFPDSPNHPAFPTTVLRPGEVFHTRTVWRFAGGGP